MDNDKVRSFIAIELPADLKRMIGIFQKGLETSEFNFVKWVDPESIHITLKFLGDQTLASLEIVRRVLNICAAGCKPFTLSTGPTGCFPNYKRARVFWLGLDGNLDSLISLQKEIDRSLAHEGFPQEDRPFTAHLTLARLRDECSQQHRLEFAGKVQGVSFEPSCSFDVGYIVLMKSTLTTHGPLYTKLSEFKLRA